MGMGTHKIKGEDYYQCRDVKAERDKLLEEVAKLLHRLEATEKERGALRARIKEMEKQEPVAWCATDEAETVIEALGMNQSRRFDTALYLAPGAQPASIIPEVDALAQFIREIDGAHRLGAGVLAERIVAWLAAAPEAKP